MHMIWGVLLFFNSTKYEKHMQHVLTSKCPWKTQPGISAFGNKFHYASVHCSLYIEAEIKHNIHFHKNNRGKYYHIQFMQWF